MKVIPVIITYDRIFDASYLANEMVSGEFTQINMVQLLKQIYQYNNDKLGKIIVKYANPIDIDDFVG